MIKIVISIKYYIFENKKIVSIYLLLDFFSLKNLFEGVLSQGTNQPRGSVLPDYYFIEIILFYIKIIIIKREN